MTLFVRTIGLEASPALHAYVQRRIASAVGRLLGPLDTLVVRLSDDNGPRGGVDKRCRIVARGGSAIVVEAVDEDLFAAVDRACDRLAVAFVRDVERRRGDRARAPSVRGTTPSRRPRSSRRTARSA